MGKYTGKTAVITGGTTGIGFGAAKALVAEGAEVLVTGRTPDTLEAARRELGPRAHAVRSDGASLADIEALGEHVARLLGGIDLGFINAGYCKIEPFSAVSLEEYDRTFALNTRGVFFTVKRLAPLVRDGGAFVFTTSVADAVGYPGMSVYSGTKAAIHAFARVFAAELLPRRIRVNSVSPGFVRTPTMGIYGAGAKEVAAFEKEGDLLTPMKRIATTDEIARTVLYLAFEATFTTGMELVVDGGLTSLVAPPSS
jgi:NAD(P)-dependent dehydrogenase (short-subunit alcohol dehydrogenase family)